MANKKEKILQFFEEELIEPTEETAEPTGNNSLSAYSIFEERKYYTDTIYPSEMFVPKPFDIWNERIYFGKVNFDGDACFAAKDGLKQVENNVWALDFVADAFNEFKQQFLFLNKRQVEGTPYELLTPTRGWSSAIDLYDQYMDSVYGVFLTYVEDSNKQSKIKTFNEFMDVMYDFVNDSSPNIPLTFSNFITSNKCPNTISGLMIDISTNKHDNDEDKYNNFINDPNFECFANTAERFGFKIDKNFPGRLIADINSPVMNREGNIQQPSWDGGAGYMQKYPSKPEIFNEQAPPEPVLKEIKPPKQEPEIPFDVGDMISIATVRSSEQQPFTYYMLKNYTDIKNRYREPGYRPKKVNDKNMYLYLRDTVLSEKNPSTLIPLYGKVMAINPSETEGQLYFGSTYTVPSYDVLVIKLGAENGLLGQSPQNIWSNDTLLSAESDELAQNVTYSPGSQEYEHNYSSLNNTASPATYIQVPLDVLHLKEGNLPFVYSRFNDRVNYSIKLEKYQQQLSDNKRIYDEQHSMWEQATNDYQERLKIYNDQEDFYLTAPRMSTLNLFDRRYGSAHIYDIDLLKEICLQFYFSYVTLSPEVTITEYINCPSGKLTRQKKIKREKITRDKFNKDYPNTYWIKQYILMLNAQSQNKKSFDKLRKIKTRALQVYELSGVSKTLIYLRDEMIKK
jgi:hypothetical protein